MKNRDKNIAPLIITVMIFSFVLFLGWSAYQAATRGSEISDRDYYSKGLKYNTTLIEKKAASVLGWVSDVSLHAHTFKVSLYDSQHLPVSNGEATLLLYHGSSATPLKLSLTEVQPGSYQLELPANLTGEIRARLDLVRDGASINRNLLLNL
jgi:nitrogen fixation protein FixH